jgi:hypothetical protein
MRELRSYRTVSVVTTRTAAAPVTVKIDASFEAPDKVRAITTIGHTVIHTITIAGNTWIYDAKVHRWKSKLTPSGGQHPADPFAFMDGMNDLSSRAGAQGTQILTGRVQSPVLLRAFSSGTSVPLSTVQVTCVIDAATGRLMSVRTDGAGLPFSVQVRFEDLGRHFGIRAP